MHLRYASAFTLTYLALLFATPLKAQDAVRVTAIPQVEVVTLAADGPSIFAASFEQIYRSSDGGETWTETSPLPVDTSDVNVLTVHDGVLYVGTNGSGVFASNDDGASWAHHASGLTGVGLRVTVLAARGDSLYAGTDGAGVRVLDLQSPSSWTSFSQNLPAQGVMSLTVSGTTLIAGGGPSGSVYIRPQGSGAWTTVPLDALDPQNQALEFLPLGRYVLAGTAKGIYRSLTGGEAWHAIHSSMPESGDISALTRYGARVYASVRHQGYSIYSSDDNGVTWSLRADTGIPIYDLMASHDRLWVGRGDGLWYYDVSASPRLFQATLTAQVPGEPLGRGSVLGMLEGGDLHLTGFFRGLTAPWLQLDVYRGDPATDGELLKEIGFTIPEGGGSSGGFDATVSLSDSEITELLSEELYFHIKTLGSTNDDASGRILLLPMQNPTLLETRLSGLWGGAYVLRGKAVGMLEGDNLRLVGFGHFATTVSQVSLFRGEVAEPGEHVATLWMNFSGDMELTAGFDNRLPLTEELRQNLLDGHLYLDVQTFGLDDASGRLFDASNQGPAASAILAPTEGASIVIGGAAGEDPMDPEAPLAEIRFTAAEDPEESPVSYIWQLSRSTEFATGATAAIALGPDSTTIPLTVALAAALYDTTWTATAPLHTPVTFYHRVITTDGSLYTTGPEASLTITRGTITSSEPPQGLPERLVLHGNYPNPFNPATTLAFDLPSNAEVRIDVFDMLGRHVLSVPAGMIAAGARRTVDVDGSSLPSGSYVYRVIATGAASSQVAVGRTVLLK